MTFPNHRALLPPIHPPLKMKEFSCSPPCPSDALPADAEGWAQLSADTCPWVATRYTSALAEILTACRYASSDLGLRFRKPLKMSVQASEARMPLFGPERRCDMFRVSYSDTADGQRWSLHGRLAGPWVDELRSCWKHARDRAPLASATVDLKEVTFIDQAGEKLLAEMRSAGAELIAAGVEHQHLLATLDNHTGPPARQTTQDGGNK